MSDLPTSDRVLLHLKSRGPSSAQAIADAFGMTHMGAHKALQGLVAGEWVQFEDVSSGRGRPKRLFSLTEAGHGRFPDRHAELNVEMIRSIRSVFGQKGLDKLIADREAKQVERYASAADADLETKLQTLAAARAAEGYMARLETQDDGSTLLIEDHCPICAAAETCEGFCRSELAIFTQLIGPDAEISREEHILSGARRCVYRIRALD